MHKGDSPLYSKDDETVKVLRIHKIDDEIRRGTYPNVPKLAKLFEVSERTINRDLDIMRDQFYAPMEYDRQKRGFYYTDKDFYIKYLPLKEGDLFSLALFDTLLIQYKNTPLESALRTIFKKIISTLPNKVSIDSTFLCKSITCIPDPLPCIDPEMFSKILHAVQIQKNITFDYKPLQKTTFMNRTLSPYHIVCQRGNWYVIGFCHYSNEIRIFSFSRIQNLILTDVAFTIPSTFSVEQYIDTNIGVWVSDKKSYNVKLLFMSGIGTFAAEHIWHEDQEVYKHRDGSVEVSFVTTQMQEVKRWVLGQGSTVKVLEPKELIEQIRKEVRLIEEMYVNDRN